MNGLKEWKKRWNKINKKDYMADWNRARKEEKDLVEAIVAKAKAKSALHSVTWHRIVLDEAHSIKVHKCSKKKISM